MTLRTVKCIKTFNENIVEGNTYSCYGKWHDADAGEYWYYVVDPVTKVWISMGEWIDGEHFEVVTEEIHV